MPNNPAKTEERETHAMPNAAHLTAASRLLSSRMSVGLFPPNSNVTFFKLLPAAALRICRPTSVEPVNATLPMPIWPLIAAPATLPSPVTTLTTPGGNPACAISSAMRMAVRGVHSDGLKTIVFPVASAGPSFQESIQMGKFHGTICPTTPILDWVWVGLDEGRGGGMARGRGRNSGE